MVSYIGVEAIGVVTLIIGLQASCHMSSGVFLSWFSVLIRRREERRHDSRRRLSTVMPDFAGLMFARMGS
jgi:hypothetical protein